MKNHKIQQVRLGDLVVEFTLCSRGKQEIDPYILARVRDAREAGRELEMPWVDRKTKRVSDGRHRVTEWLRAYGEDHKIKVHMVDYDDDRELFLHAADLNNRHGQPLSHLDKAHCILRAAELKVPDDELAKALCMSVDKIGDLRAERVGELQVKKAGSPQPTYLKAPYRQLAGRKMNPRQAEANKRASGMRPAFHANQLIDLIESGVLDLSDEGLLERLKVLNRHLTEILKGSGGKNGAA